MYRNGSGIGNATAYKFGNQPLNFLRGRVTTRRHRNFPMPIPGFRGDESKQRHRSMDISGNIEACNRPRGCSLDAGYIRVVA